MQVVNLNDIRHGIRVANYSIEIAREIDYAAHKLENLYLSGLFHDIGKAYISQSIINKPDMLTEHEKELILKHPIYSYEEVLNIGYPKEVAINILHHHENFNGTGYPKGLKEFSIPVGSRILKVSDVFDALTSDRPYKNRLSVKEALKVMDMEKATYDPEIYLAFRRFLYSKYKNQIITPGYPNITQILKNYNKINL